MLVTPRHDLKEQVSLLTAHGQVADLDRLALILSENKTQALTGRNEAAKTDLKAPGPGAADAFRNSV